MVDRLTGVVNYQAWSRVILDYLLVKNKICFINGSCNRDSMADADRLQWDRCNACVKAWLLNSIVKELHGGMICTLTVHSIWKDLKQRYDKMDGIQILQLH